MVSQFVRTEKQDGVFVITMVDDKTRNALGPEMTAQLIEALDTFESSPELRVLVLTGQDPSFCSGANVRGFQDQIGQPGESPGFFSAMPWKDMNPEFSLKNPKVQDENSVNQFIPWRLWQIQKPTIAAVNGYALGGGCELAMMCDLLIASEKAKFGQPEINLGTFPGSGGTQRLPKTIGKAKAMDLILTARMIDADEAEKLGLTSRVLIEDNFIEQVLEIAKEISEKSLPVLKMAKAAVNGAFENTLSQGVLYEKKIFQSTFALEDRKEGMQAFIEKRKPKFENK